MYKALWWNILFISCFLFIVACAPASPTAIPPVSDQEMEVAVKQAHETMNILLRHLLAPNPAYRFVGVKARFTGTEVGIEDHWTEPIDYYNNVFTVRMLDGLTLNTGLHAEQFVEVPIENILDWMIVESNGNLLGGYTIRLAYEHMTPEEQEEFSRVTEYIIK